MRIFDYEYNSLLLTTALLGDWKMFFDYAMRTEPAKPDVPASDRLKAAMGEQPIEQWSDSKLISMAQEFLHEECGEEIYAELGKRGIYDWMPAFWDPPEPDIW